MLFNKTKRAHEVLSDPHKRAIYDNLGTKGLETEGWEVVQRTKTPQEIREEYERLAQQKEERRLLQRTNPKSSITVSVDATNLFSPYEDEYDEFGYEKSLPFCLCVSFIVSNVSSQVFRPSLGRDQGDELLSVNRSSSDAEGHSLHVRYSFSK